jgi:hypothetical protein
LVKGQRLIVTELTDRPTIEKVLASTNVLFLGLLSDAAREHLMLLKDFKAPLFARSENFQNLLLSERPTVVLSPPLPRLR